MKDVFLKALVAVSAAGIFGVGAATFGSGILSFFDTRVKAVVQDTAPAAVIAEEQAPVLTSKSSKLK